MRNIIKKGKWLFVAFAFGKGSVAAFGKDSMALIGFERGQCGAAKKGHGATPHSNGLDKTL